MKNLIFWISFNISFNRRVTALLIRLLKRRMLLAKDSDMILYRQLDEWQSYEVPKECHLYSDAPHVKAALEN